ncbi:glycerophosphoryl diester phosphodiesterase [Novymonas esmeraldas]|uniref:Glycerophosphoryl diester phosphodiesterase n=1 Tax=Novymonas esmeraldas TaxID=1808958 RepID=A0AAW0EYS9_9TRYP
MRALAFIALAAGVYVVGAVCVVQIAGRSKRRKASLKKRFPYSLTNIAHRGGSLLGPENTLFTFTRAVRDGLCDMIELDVRESQDGEVVVCHDHTLERTCGPKYAGVSVANVVVGGDPSQTLPQSQRTIKLEFATQELSQFEASESVPVDDTTRICLLKEVLEMFPRVPLHVDIKDTSKPFVYAVLNLIALHNRESTTFIGSSSQQNQQFINDYFAEKGAEVRKRYRIFAGPRDFFRTHLLFYTGLLPFFSVNYDVFSIPVFTTTMKAGAVQHFGKVLGNVATFVLSSPVLWRYLESRGVAVIGWNFNDELDILQALGWPLNGVMSDDPLKVRRVMVENKDAVRLYVLGD